MIDVSELSDADLESLRVAVAAEMGRRHAEQEAIGSMDALIRDTLARLSREPGGEWVQPTHALDSYPDGWVVTMGGRRYESLIFANVTVPGTDGRWWRDLGPVDPDPDEPEPDPDTPPVWTVGVAYTVGDTVTYDGHTYTCLQSHTSQPGWEPPNVPALWTKED